MITRVPTIDQSDMEFVYGDSQNSQTSQNSQNPSSVGNEVSGDVIQEDVENPGVRNSNQGNDFTITFIKKVRHSDIYN